MEDSDHQLGEIGQILTATQRNFRSIRKLLASIDRKSGHPDKPWFLKSKVKFMLLKGTYMPKSTATKYFERCINNPVPHCHCSFWGQWSDDRADFEQCKFKQETVGTRRFMSERTDWCENHFGRMRL